jgi:hypothetical protein
MKYWLFFPLSLFATVNEPICWKLMSGYRNDHIHYYSKELNEELTDIEFWENALSLKAINRDLTFYLKGGGSAFGKEGGSRGFSTDGTGYLGYAVNLTAERLYQVLLTPLAGFSGHYEKIDAFRQTWYGPYIGGSIFADPGRSLSFEVGYAYNWLFLRLHTDQVKETLSGNHGQSGWAEIEWQVATRTKLGALGTIDYFFGADHARLRFTSISVLFTISREL